MLIFFEETRALKKPNARIITSLVSETRLLSILFD